METAYITTVGLESLGPKKKTLSDAEIFKGLEAADLKEDFEEPLRELLDGLFPFRFGVTF